MKEVKLIIDGKEYIVQMKDEDVKTVMKPKTGYEFSDEDDLYFAIDTFCQAIPLTNFSDAPTFELHDIGNHYLDKQLAENIARADRLYRRLRQWQALNDKPVGCIDWNDDTCKYQIYYNYCRREIRWGDRDTVRDFGALYFSSIEVVEAAIEEFRDELTWYFTEFKQRLDERTIK